MAQGEKKATEDIMLYVYIDAFPLRQDICMNTIDAFCPYSHTLYASAIFH